VVHHVEVLDTNGILVRCVQNSGEVLIARNRRTVHTLGQEELRRQQGIKGNGVTALLCADPTALHGRKIGVSLRAAPARGKCQAQERYCAAEQESQNGRCLRPK